MEYDEFGLLHENADEYDLPYDPAHPPTVTRVHVDAPSGHTVSAIAWGEGTPELVLLHGGAQNAHTWDTVALALDRPVLAVDLPGHGHSQWRHDKDYRPDTMAIDVTAVIEELAPGARGVVGMSLGGLTAAAAVSRRATLCERLAIVDVTPGVNEEKASVVTNFVAGPETFASFEEILERTIAFNPTRSEASLRRGVLHNAKELPDGTWTWRYDRFDRARLEAHDLRMGHLWDAFGAIEQPMLFLKGGTSPVVDEDDLDELRRRKPDVRIEVVDDAGHSIQGDKPVELAGLLGDFLDEDAPDRD